MDIDIPDTSPEQRVTIDERKDFRSVGDLGFRKLRQGFKNDLSLTQLA